MKGEEVSGNASGTYGGRFLQVEFLEDGRVRMTIPNTCAYESLVLETALKALDDEIGRAAARRSDRHGFISYRSASGFGRDWSRIVAKAVDPLLDREEWDVAVALVLQGLKSTWPIDIDDSDGIISDMFFDVHGYFDYVLEHAGVDFEEHLIEAICDYLCDPPTKEHDEDMYELQVDDLEQYLFKHFGSDARHAGQIARFAQTRLDQKKAEYDAALLAKEDKGRSRKLERAEQSVGTWVMRLLHAHKLQGARVQELVEIAGDDATMERVCLMLQAEARTQGDTQLARELLERTKQRFLAAGHPYPLGISERLAELLGEDEVEALREELLYQMNFQESGFRTRSRVPALWPRLRATFDEDEWTRVRDEWAARLTGTWGRLEALESDGRYGELMDEAERRGIDALRHFETTLSAFYPERMLRAYLASRVVSPAVTDGLWKQVKATYPDEAWPELARELVSLIPDADKRMGRLAEEEMYDELMSEVEQAGIAALPAWRAILSEHRPDRVVAMLADDLLNGACLKPANRKDYIEFCRRVVALKELPGGSEWAARVVAETRRRYPNRPALLEELDKL